MTLQIIQEFCYPRKIRLDVSFNSRVDGRENQTTDKPANRRYSQHDRLQRIAFNGRLIVRVVARSRINGRSWDRFVQSQ